jgi:hypothetical protein
MINSQKICLSPDPCTHLYLLPLRLNSSVCGKAAGRRSGSGGSPAEPAWRHIRGRAPPPRHAEGYLPAWSGTCASQQTCCSLIVFASSSPFPCNYELHNGKQRRQARQHACTGSRRSGGASSRHKRISRSRLRRPRRSGRYGVHFFRSPNLTNQMYSTNSPLTSPARPAPGGQLLAAPSASPKPPTTQPPPHQHPLPGRPPAHPRHPHRSLPSPTPRLSRSNCKKKWPR